MHGRAVPAGRRLFFFFKQKTAYEILSGSTQDANLAFLAQGLNEAGIRLREARVIPDDPTVIVSTVNEVRSTFDYVFTTGGSGPTHDDSTAQCVADAFGVSLVLHPDAK